jgi:hypothetical protein
MLLLATAGNYRVQSWGGLQWHSIHAKFHENQSTASKVKRGTHKDNE